MPLWLRGNDRTGGDPGGKTALDGRCQQSWTGVASSVGLAADWLPFPFLASVRPHQMVRLTYNSTCPYTRGDPTSLDEQPRNDAASGSLWRTASSEHLELLVPNGGSTQRRAHSAE